MEYDYSAFHYAEVITVSRRENNCITSMHAIYSSSKKISFRKKKFFSN